MEQRIKVLRENQDLKWIKSNITKDFGHKGLEKVRKLISRNKSPFRTLNELKKNFNFY